MTERAKVLDLVALARDQGEWVAGTVGTVVEAFADSAYVELVGREGVTLDILTVPYSDLRVIPSGDPQLAV
jgi:hypothetical protein